MNCYGANGVCDEVFGALHSGHAPPRPTNYNDAEIHFGEFSRSARLPIFARGSRADRCELYGRCVKAHAVLHRHVSPASSTWHAQNYGLCTAFAPVGGAHSCGGLRLEEGPAEHHRIDRLLSTFYAPVACGGRYLPTKLRLGWYFISSTHAGNRGA